MAIALCGQCMYDNHSLCTGGPCECTAAGHNPQPPVPAPTVETPKED